MNVEVRQALLDEQLLIKDLIGPYIEELDQFEERSGGYNLLRSVDLSDSDRVPFTIWASGQLVGFALVRRITMQTEPAMEVEEFYVRPEFQRQGIGTAAAIEVWKKFPGKWVAEVTKKNPASSFWRKCIEGNSKLLGTEEFRTPGGWRFRFLFEV